MKLSQVAPHSIVVVPTASTEATRPYYKSRNGQYYRLISLGPLGGITVRPIDNQEHQTLTEEIEVTVIDIDLNLRHVWCPSCSHHEGGKGVLLDPGVDLSTLAKG